MESQNGLETALSLFCAASAFYVFLRIVRDVGSTSRARWLVFGAVVGLTLLARTDNALLAACLGLYLLLRRPGQLGATLGGLALSAATAALLLLPWLWWNQHTFGGIVQSSAVAAPAVFRQALWQPLHEGAPWAQVWREGLWPVIHLSLLLAFRYAGVAWTALVVGALLVRLLRRRWLPSQADLRKMGPLLPALVASLLLLAVHTLVRWYPRSWYFVPLAWSSALVAGAVLGNVATALNADRLGRRLLPVGAVGLVLLLGLQGIKDWRQGFYPWQGHMLAGANWVAAETPAGAVVASFNTGLQSYYGQRQVVNLDGVVSWEAVRAIQSHSLFAYAADRGVDFLVDYQAYVLGQYGPYLGVDGGACLLVNRVLSPEYPPYGAVTVYTLDPGCANQAD